MLSNDASSVRMKWILVVFVVTALAGVRCQKYTNKYDNLNIEQILSNDRLYGAYYNCLANTGKCTPEALELKKVLPDALATECAKCSDQQRRGIEKVMKFMVTKKAGDLAVLEKIYDPQGVYRKRYRALAQQHGVKI